MKFLFFYLILPVSLFAGTCKVTYTEPNYRVVMNIHRGIMWYVDYTLYKQNDSEHMRIKLQHRSLENDMYELKAINVEPSSNPVERTGSKQVIKKWSNSDTYSTYDMSNCSPLDLAISKWLINDWILGG